MVTGPARTNVYERLMAWTDAQAFHHSMPQYVLIDREDARALAEEVRAVAAVVVESADCIHGDTYLHGMDVQDYQLHLKTMMEHAQTLRAAADRLAPDTEGGA